MKESEDKSFALTSKGIKSLGSTFKEVMHGHCDKGTFQVVGKSYKIEEAKQIAEDYYIKRWLKGEK